MNPINTWINKEKRSGKRQTTHQHSCALSVVLIVLSGFILTGCKKSPSHLTDESSSDSKQETSSEIQPGTKVLLVHSYHTGYPWVDAITRGVRMVLSDANVDLQVYYMDTKRRTSEQWKKAAGEKACELINEWRPDIVVGK